MSSPMILSWISYVRFFHCPKKYSFYSFIECIIITTYNILKVTQDAELVKMLDLKAEWVLWQTGMQLKYGDIVLFTMREILHNSNANIYRQLK